ncbi:MAG: T9SS type A sorting domain-containing protein [Chitinispirillaceae bacterium]|nr:T9SS type A sorting domain-containing protein [Chitinispirillaceae bacterium]
MRIITGNASSIRYTLPKHDVEQTRVKIDLYDLNGSFVKTLVNESKSTGRSYTVALNGSNGTNIPAGTYLCTLSAAGIQQSAKVIVK